MIRYILAFITFSLPVTAQVNIQEVTSPGGIKAWLVEEHAIPFVAMKFLFNGGSVLDPVEKQGAASMMVALLEEGSGDMDAQAFKSAQDSLAASFGFDVSAESVSVSARFLTENRADSVALLKQALNHPRFDQAAIDRVRGQMMSILASQLKDANFVARQTFNGLAFGDHPYARSPEGTSDTLQTVTQADIIAAHSRLLIRDQIYIGVVGDISAADLSVMLDDLFGGLPRSKAHDISDVEIGLHGGVSVVDMPVPQSVALFGHSGIDRNDPDFFAAYILNEILGGRGLQSRLGLEVREKRGLTYGIGSYLIEKDHANLYMGKVASANDRIAETIDVIRAEWAKAASFGVTADELNAVKTYLTGAYPLQFDGNAQIANILAYMQNDELPLDYITTRNGEINAVTLEQVNRVAATLLQPDALHFVVVGQPEGL